MTVYGYFHPELIRVLDKRIGTIPDFQRARGALKLLAEVIAAIWNEQRDAEVINVADLDFSRADVLGSLTTGLGRPDFAQVARVDFAGPYLVTGQSLRSFRRYAIVAITAAAGVLSPPDPFSMIAMALPTILLYEAGIWRVDWVEKQRAAKAAATQQAATG